MKVSVKVETEPSRTVRAQQLSAAFDVPPAERQVIEWHGDMPIEDRPWNVGLIVGPSGSGKTTIARDVWGEQEPMPWSAKSTVDDFPGDMSIEDVTAACQAVGFNTIPAWLRPFDVLSNGEQFRASMARLMAEVDTGHRDGPIVVDEFTSVVDRQVAQIGAHAVQKWARKRDEQFVAVTCHYDVIDWLQPDWILEPAGMAFTWRSLQQRPSVACVIERVPYDAWRLFAPFHYLTAELNHGAACYALFAGEEEAPAAFAGVLHRPHPKRRNLKGVSRLVTLPDWQGLGLAFALVDRIGAAYRSLGFELHTYPAHPALIRSFDRSPVWQMRTAPGKLTPKHGPESMQTGNSTWRMGRRQNAVFRFVGERMDPAEAARLTSPLR